MIDFLQSLSLKVRFLGVLLLGFPVLVTQWLVAGAPWALARLQMVSAGAGLPDFWFWYTPAQLSSLVAAWGEAGSSVYRQVLWPSDAAFALAYGAFLTALVLYLLKKGSPHRSWWYTVALVPGLGAAGDLLEDALVSWFTLVPWEPVAWVAAAATTLKWTALVVTLGLLVVGTLGVWLSWLVAKWRSGSPPGGDTSV